MGTIHVGATLTPHFRDFLPAWVARQAWYRGAGVPSLRPVGYFRFEDPGGAVGVETHLVANGDLLYQVPLTYRGAALADGRGLVATAAHSVLGTRWIYDGERDPVWVGELLRLVRTGGVSEPSRKRGVGPAEARGQQLVPFGDDARIELRRVVDATAPPAGVAGVVTGTWRPDDGDAVSGCLAVVHR